MTDISCATWDTEEDKRMADEWAEKEAGNPWRPSPEIAAEIEKAMPEIREAAEREMVRCLEENVEKGQETIRESLKGTTPTELAILDQELWPTHQQLDEMVKAGQELGVDETEIIATSLIVGTVGVEDMDKKISDVMYALHTSEISPQFRDDIVFSKIMYVEKQEMGITGPKMADFNPVTKVLHLYKNALGQFPTRETIKWTILPHEVFHANKDDFMQRINEHRVEWEVASLLEGERPSPYALQLWELRKGGIVSEERYQEELAAEWYRRYLAGECSKGTAEFFSRYFSE